MAQVSDAGAKSVASRGIRVARKARAASSFRKRQPVRASHSAPRASGSPRTGSQPLSSRGAGASSPSGLPSVNQQPPGRQPPGQQRPAGRQPPAGQLPRAGRAAQVTGTTRQPAEPARRAGQPDQAPGPAQAARPAVRQADARAAIRTDARPGAHAKGAKSRVAKGSQGQVPSAAQAALAVPRADVASAPEAKAAVPWYERARSYRAVAGHQHCGHLERILHRDWPAGEIPPPEIVLAVERLAALPQLIKERLAVGLDAIYLGPGGVPDIDDMGELSGVSLPSGRATWDACAGAYGDRKIIVGSRPSPTPDVMCHEIGHALDDIDGPDGSWQSDTAEFSELYDLCWQWMSSPFHRQGGMLGRREFFADAFAAIASSQRPALVEMVGGNTRAALQVMLYFNVRYGI